MIEVEGLWKSYGKVCTLEGVDLSVAGGTVHGLGEVPERYRRA